MSLLDTLAGGTTSPDETADAPSTLPAGFFVSTSQQVTSEQGNPPAQGAQDNFFTGGPPSLSSSLTGVSQSVWGWFASLFSFNRSVNPTIKNDSTNAVDVPQYPVFGIWDKYGLDYGTGWSGTGGLGADSTGTGRNTAPASDQSWFTSIWSGVKKGTQFVFCPIFTDCPAPLPPGGITLGDVSKSAGNSVGQGLQAALSPLLPFLVILVVGVVALNLLIGRLERAGAQR